MEPNTTVDSACDGRVHKLGKKAVGVIPRPAQLKASKKAPTELVVPCFSKGERERGEWQNPVVRRLPMDQWTQPAVDVFASLELE
jgi:hypothetical protein